MKVKLKLLESKANDIYEGILKRRFSSGGNLMNKQFEYNICKRCVFLGGEKFKDKILENEDLYKLIEKKESNKIVSEKMKMNVVKEWLKDMISS